MSAGAAELKSCCADAYASDAARWLIGDRLHPGGAALTSELVAALELRPASVAADVACGPGASAIQLVQEGGCRVVGVDLSEQSVTSARAAAEAAGVSQRASFLVGDAEALPFDDASLDAALCECALCTFPDKEQAVAELARVLRPGGRLALSDVVADPARLPAALRTLEGWIACLADARALDELAAILDAAGLEVELTRRHDDALSELLDRVEARLRAAGVLGGALPGDLRGPIERGLDMAAAAREALAAGSLGYASMVAHRRNSPA
jgi:SAM-dependent methyltransferase